MSYRTREQYNPILDVSDLTKVFRSGGGTLTVLDSVSYKVDKGSSVAIVGPSGSGKTTLIGLCAGLDEPTSGSVRLLDRDLGAMTEDERASLRLQHVGFVFQTFQLLPSLTALENVMVPLELSGRIGARDNAARLLERVGLGSRLTHYPAQLSGGEQQRVALARAFVNKPKVLFADEPTGNLDTETGASIAELLFELNREENTTLLLVTHDLELARSAQRLIRLRAGRIESDTMNGSPSTSR
jgi:putative ABC transport system ATP-binding protein